MIKKLCFALGLGSILIACSTEPASIEYGFDHCHYCEMTIVDQSHAAQIVTQKGKTFKFDAVECMIHFAQDQENQTFAKVLVANYIKPGEMIIASEAHYIISKEIPSPMGANLSAVGGEENAKKIIIEKSGEVFTWPSIQKRFK